MHLYRITLFYMLCFTQNVYADHIESRQQDPTYSQGAIVSNSGIKYELINEKKYRLGIIYNDVLISGGKVDQDYTSGVSVTLSGLRATKYFLSIDGALDQVL